MTRSDPVDPERPEPGAARDEPPGASPSAGTAPKPPSDEKEMRERIATLERRVEELAAERRHMAAVLEVLPVGVWIAEPDGRIVARNAAAAEIWDRDARLSERTKDYERDYPAWRLDGERVASEEWGMARALGEGETTLAEELEIETAEGRRKRILNYAAPVLDAQGRVAGGVAVNVDITARREAEAKGVRQEQILRAVSQGVVVADPDGVVTYWNPAAEELFGWNREEAEGRHVLELTIPEGRREGAARILEAVGSGEPWLGELEVQRKDGSPLPVRIALDRITDLRGEHAGLVGLATDLTAWEEARARREELIQALERERSRLEEVFQGAPAIMAVLRGPDHVFEMANPLYRQFLGGRELIGHPVREALPEMVEQGLVELLDRVRETGVAHRGEEERIVLRNDPGGEGHAVYLNYVYQPLASADEEVTRIVVHGVDVTALVEARQRAEAASRAKSDFLAAMSHELRTPLNAIIGYASLVEAGVPVEVPEAAVSHVHRIALSARHLKEIIEEVLQVSRLEAGREGVERVPVRLETLVEEVEVIMAPLTREKRLELRLPRGDLPDGVLSDPRKIRQILVNLVGNAVKFTAEGGVELRIGWVDGDREWIRLEVEDTGVGIEQHEIERLFEPFWQVDRERRRTEGVGLGLAITRRLAGMLGGDVEVESEPGEGSVFTVTLPRVMPDS